MLKYDLEALQQAEESFYAYSKRESFVESKRTGQYFGGIVKNKQKEIEAAHHKHLLKRRYFLDESWRQKREAYAELIVQRELAASLKKHPEQQLVTMLVSAYETQTSLQMIPKTIVDKIRQSLGVIIKKKTIRNIIEKIKDSILSFVQLPLKVRLSLAETAERWIEEARKMGVQSVTIKL